MTRKQQKRNLWLLGIPLALFALVAIFGPVFYPYNPLEMTLSTRLRPPFSTLPTGEWTWLGTDQLGRDILGQIVVGARVSLVVGAATILLGGGIGIVIGSLAGYVGGAVDAITMRVADMQLSIPSIVLAILILSVLGAGINTLIITLAITRWARFARISRSAAIAVKERDYVVAGAALGASQGHILLRHITPFLWSPLVVVATLEVGQIIVAEAALSFLGIGTPPTQPSWGLTLANGRNYLVNAWWISTFPGIALSLVVISIALFGDQLRDYLDPKSAL